MYGLTTDSKLLDLSRKGLDVNTSAKLTHPFILAVNQIKIKSILIHSVDDSKLIFYSIYLFKVFSIHDNRAHSLLISNFALYYLTLYKSNYSLVCHVLWALLCTSRCRFHSNPIISILSFHCIQQARR